MQQLRLCQSQHAVRAESVLTRESQVCLRRPVSTARLCSLSLYIVNVLLSFTSVTASGSLPWCILDLGPNNIPVCVGFSGVCSIGDALVFFSVYNVCGAPNVCECVCPETG